MTTAIPSSRLKVPSVGRSRSPPLLLSKFSKARLPDLKSWVLVRTSARGCVSRWRDAVPALVSAIDAETCVSVLVPNLLALRHDFRGGRAFRALSGLELSQIRPYQGSDQPMLKDALLRAVQEVAASRKMSHPSPTADVDLGETDSSHASTEQQESNVGAPSAFAAEPAVGDMPAQPATPVPRKRKVLERKTTPPKPCEPELSTFVANKIVELAKPPVAEGSTTAPARARLSRKRVDEITVVIARAFATWGDSTLTRAEVGAIVQECGLDVSSAELESTLLHLDKNNKVFLTGELVIRI